jgi:MYXO-CTERM domain-containing protein
MRPHNLCLLTGLALALLLPRAAMAHIEITSHTTRYGVATQKSPPCGMLGGSGPGANVYTYAPGETITLSWHEFIDHPGHYRVAFDDSGDDGFADPANAADLFNNATVMLDGIADETDVHDYEVELTLPDVECETCTIQILQIMTDKPPFGNGDDMYYHCIDVRLVAEGGDGDGDPGDGDGDPGDGDGDPGDGDGDGDGDPAGDGDGDGDSGDGDGDPAGETETGAAPIDDDASGCACTTTPARPLSAVPLSLLILGLLRRRRA